MLRGWSPKRRPQTGAGKKERMIMKILLFHEDFDINHLQEVIEEMKTLGAPVIKAVWVECQNMWYALEGCHRIRAAKELGLSPVIDEIDYEDGRNAEEIGLDADWDKTPADIVDMMDTGWGRSGENIVIDF